MARRHAAALNWRAALVLGLISSSFSTAVSQLAAARLGRDASVDWMSVAAIPARDWAITTEPTWTSIAIGIAFHQWADISWAVLFFGLLGRWTARLRPAALAAIAVPWAIATSALEWLLLVPIAPFAQPIFTLQQPYWIGFLVHLSSALMYPFFPLLRWSSAERAALFGHGPFLRVWGAAMAAGLLMISVVATLGALGRELPWRGQDRDLDQRFMRHMSTHHQQGIAIATLAAERAIDPHLRALARLMAASQTGESAIFTAWWSSWFEEPMPLCSAEERATMPGLLSDAQLTALRDAQADAFDARFVHLMSLHHAGAVRMADERLRAGGGDPRLAVMAHAIRHAQQGEIALMRGVKGADAVRLAIRNLFGDNINRH
ncbi:hypothetical protein X566_01120 [Afipia sp. P52-10]|uniref:DUF305 domain-containing protein n=1 Tax=Afipia sp. P52-10 TaxID=1429916 RepID=UPI0003DF0F34|nr:DUF305 domain-containing protein [Afipia sp. P52-10]ETR79237.1 hypothetical protein X566_01120 [Afipia sp. P52-10]